MTKSKTFWAVAALLSLGIMLFAGYSVYERISLHFSGDTVEIKPTAPPPLPQAAEEEEAAPKPAEKAPAPETAKPVEPEKVKAIKTLFEYKDAKAKSVYLAGSFTAWKDVKMTKKDGVWKVEIYVLPGTYPYHFTVDGKKKVDPGKPKAPMGESVVIIAPAGGKR
jgi:hypothetical protein